MWAVDYRGNGEYSIEEGAYRDLASRYPFTKLKDSRESAEEYARHLADIEMDRVKVYAFLSDRESGTGKIIHGTMSELKANGVSTWGVENFFSTEEEALRCKQHYEWNMSGRRQPS